MATIANNGADIDTDDLKAKNVNVSSLSNSFSATSKVFKDYPTLLFDGPFAFKSSVSMSADRKSVV